MVPDEVRYPVAAALVILGLFLSLLGLKRRRSRFKYDIGDPTNTEKLATQGRGLIFIYSGIMFVIIGVVFFTTKF